MLALMLYLRRWHGHWALRGGLCGALILVLLLAGLLTERAIVLHGLNAIRLSPPRGISIGWQNRSVAGATITLSDVWVRRDDPVRIGLVEAVHFNKIDIAVGVGTLGFDADGVEANIESVGVPTIHWTLGQVNMQGLALIRPWPGQHSPWWQWLDGTSWQARAVHGPRGAAAASLAGQIHHNLLEGVRVERLSWTNPIEVHIGGLRAEGLDLSALSALSNGVASMDALYSWYGLRHLVLEGVSSPHVSIARGELDIDGLSLSPRLSLHQVKVLNISVPAAAVQIGTTALSIPDVLLKAERQDQQWKVMGHVSVSKVATLEGHITFPPPGSQAWRETTRFPGLYECVVFVQDQGVIEALQALVGQTPAEMADHLIAAVQSLPTSEVKPLSLETLNALHQFVEHPGSTLWLQALWPHLAGMPASWPVEIQARTH